MTAPRRILVLGYAAIGDLIFFLPVLEALRASAPNAHVVFVANDYPTTRELLPATGLVDDIWFCDWEGPRGEAVRAQINERIVRAGFDWAVLSLSSPAHYFRRGLRSVPVRAGHWRGLSGGPLSRARRSWATGEWSRRWLCNRAGWARGPALARNLRLLDFLGVPHQDLPRPRLPISPEHRRRATELLGPKQTPRVGVHLGEPGNQYGKMWAPERFGELCARLSEGAPLDFVMLGAQAERPSAEAALKRFGGLRDFVGRTPLLETFASIETCDLFLSNDTGLAKASMALGVPTATWWGPSDPAEYGALWEPEKHLDIRTGIVCSPCSRMGMARLGRLNYRNCGHHDCLRALEVAFALAALRARFGPLLDPARQKA